MSKRKFKEGDMVTVCNFESANFLRKGQITEIIRYPSNKFKVKMISGYNQGMSYWFGENSLEFDEHHVPSSEPKKVNYYLLHDEMEGDVTIFNNDEDLESQVNDIVVDGGVEALDSIKVYSLNDPIPIDLNIKVEIGD